MYVCMSIVHEFHHGLVPLRIVEGLGVEEKRKECDLSLCPQYITRGHPDNMSVAIAHSDIGFL